MIFNQRDPRWAQQRLGTVDGITIGGYGCYVSSEAMVATHFGKDTDPARLDDYYTNHGLYASGDLIIDGSLTKVYPDIVYVSTYNCQTISCDLNQFLDCNGFGREAIIEVDFDHNPTDGIQTHFVRFNSYDPNTGQLLIDDPWYGDEINFRDRYGDPAQTIQKIVKYDGPVPPAPVAPVAPPAPAVTVPEPAPVPAPVAAPVAAPVVSDIPQTLSDPPVSFNSDGQSRETSTPSAAPSAQDVQTTTPDPSSSKNAKDTADSPPTIQPAAPTMPVKKEGLLMQITNKMHNILMGAAMAFAVGGALVNYLNSVESVSLMGLIVAIAGALEHARITTP